MVVWRERLRPVVSDWGAMRMVSLTLDRKRWDSGEQAYLAVQKRRWVARLIQKLFRRGLLETAEFLYAIEFHPKNPEWVHWHVGVRPAGRWPLKGDRDWKKFGDLLSELWGYGFAYQDGPTGGELSAEHCMHYLTKYISKQDVEPPEWVLDAQKVKNFRKFSTSRGLCGEPKKKAVSKGKKRKVRSPRERLEACAEKTKFLEVLQTEVRAIGETKTYRAYKHKMTVDIPFEQKKLINETLTRLNPNDQRQEQKSPDQR